MRILFLFLISFLLVSCDLFKFQIPQVSQLLINSKQSLSSTDTNQNIRQNERGETIDRYGNIITVDEYEIGREKEEERPRRQGCRSSLSRDSDFEIEALDFIDAHNLSEYVLEGRCEKGQKVEVTVNGYSVNESPYCKTGRWEIAIDLNPLSHEKTLNFEISSGRDTFCEEVKVAFISPKNYISIPALEDYYENSFLVMKYESRIKKQGRNSKGISEYRNQPVTSVSYDDARKLCTNNGSRYDLLSNEQWQNIVRDIENVDENWSLGKARPIEGNILNCGIKKGAIKEASRSDDDDCGSSSCQRNWDYYRRTHLLSTGERIWDMCGNVGEIVKGRHTENARFTDFIYKMKSANSSLNKLYGPDQNYSIVSASRRDYYFGLGEASVKSSDDLIIRGAQSAYAGIFSVHVNRKRSGNSNPGRSVGFRCVYLP